MAKLVELIETEERRGSGTSESDPVRMVKQWFTKSGELVVEWDEWKDGMRLALPEEPPIRTASIQVHMDGAVEVVTRTGHWDPGYCYAFQQFHHEVVRQ